MRLLPKRRARPRHRILRAPPREFPDHCDFIRLQPCIVTFCDRIPPDPKHRIDCAHVRKGTDGGGKLKPSDWWTVPMCAGPEGHHAEQHRIGEPAFERRYAVNLKESAMELAHQTPDRRMREAMKAAGVW